MEIIKIDLKDEKSLGQVITQKEAIELIKAELEKTVTYSKSLKIEDYSNSTQLDIVKKAKNDYVKTRNTLKRACKSERDKYRAEADKWMDAEKDLIKVIQDEEDRLGEMVKESNRLKLVEENTLKLKSRQDQLKEYDCEILKEELLEMKDQDFFTVLAKAKERFLEEKEQKLREQEAELKRVSDLKEAAEQARKEAETKAEQEKKDLAEKAAKEALEADRKAKEAIEAEKAKAEQAKQEAEVEKQKLIAEQKTKDDARKAAEDAEITRVANEQKAKKAEEKKLSKIGKYQSWLMDNNYSEHTHMLRDIDGKRILYKKISEFQL